MGNNKLEIIKNLKDTETNLKRLELFNVTKSFKYSASFGVKTYFYVDEQHELWCIPFMEMGFFKDNFKKEWTIFHSFDEIVEVQVQDRSTQHTTSYSKTSGGLGSAVVGGALFGAPGAIVGGMTGSRKTYTTTSTSVTNRYLIHIILNDMNNPCVDIVLNNDDDVNEITSVLKLILLKNEEKDKNIKSDIEVADTLKKFKELLDMGAITQEEFDMKKKQLFGGVTELVENNTETLSEASMENQEILDLKQDDNNQYSTVEIKEKELLVDQTIQNESETQSEELLSEPSEIGNDTEKLNMISEDNQEIVSPIENSENEKKQTQTYKANFCTKCGFELKNDVKFCTNCGNKIIETFSQNEYNTRKDNKKGSLLGKNTYIFLWIILIILFFVIPPIALILVIGLRIFAQFKDKFSEDNILVRIVKVVKIEKFVDLSLYILGVIMLLGGIMMLFMDWVSGLITILFGVSCCKITYKLLSKKFSELQGRKLSILRLVLPIIFLTILPIVLSRITPKITELNFIRDNVEIAINDEYYLEFKTNLSNNNANNFSWESSNESIVTVDNYGMIVGKAEGEAIIKITSNNGLMDTINVKCRYIEPEDININLIDSIFIEENNKFSATVTPSNCSNKEVIWEISDRDIATIENGIIIGKKIGKVKLKAIASNGLIREKEIEIKCRPVEALTIKIPDNLIVGNTYNIDLDVTPSIINKGLFSVASNNSKIVSVENNIVTPVANGECALIVKYLDGTEFSKKVKAIIEVSSLTFNDDSVTVKKGNNSKLKVNILPVDASKDGINWNSSNPNVATVDSNGNVKGIGKGSATVSIVAPNGNKAQCIVYVQEKSPVTINNMRYTIDYVGGVEWTWSFTNNTNKTINYITLKWNCYNGVGDPIYDTISFQNSVSVKYTGPLKAGATTSTRRNGTKFYNSSYKSSKISEIIVEYDDGTSEVLKGTDFNLYYGIINK